MRLVAGLGLSLADVEGPRGRIPWRAFVIFAQRAEKMLGAATLEELAAVATCDTVPGPIRRMLPMLSDSRPLFALAARWWGPRVFRGTRGRCEVLPDGRLREIVQILPGYAPCPEFLSGIRGTIRALPRLLNQPDALVTLEQDGREGEYLITPPPRRARWERAARLGPARFGTRRGAQSISNRLGEQSRRLETLQQLGLVLAGGADADALQEDIVRLVQERLGVGGVRLSSYGEDNRSRVAVSGTLPGVSVQSLPLVIADRRVGQLERWGVGEEAALAPLRELVPWIAIALEYGSSKALVAQLTRMLAEDARDWERMERRLEQLVSLQPAVPSPGTERSALPEGTVDLAQFMHAMAPRLRALAGDDVLLELHCANGLRPAFSDGSRLESLLATVIEILCDIGSEEIRIEARAVAEQGYATAERTTAEILVRGYGGALDEISRSRLPTALELSDTGLLVANLHLHNEPDGAVGVRFYLPMLASAEPHH
jgi:hypothetical protein